MTSKRKIYIFEYRSKKMIVRKIINRLTRRRYWPASQQAFKERVCTKGFYDHGLTIKREQWASTVIDVETFRLLDDVNTRYSKLDVNGPDWPQDDDGKLSKLVGIINSDEKIAKLDAVRTLGSILVIRSGYRDMYDGRADVPGASIIYDNKNGLQIDDEGVYSAKPTQVPATPENLKVFGAEFVNSERLRNAVAELTERRNYCERRAMFG